MVTGELSYDRRPRYNQPDYAASVRLPAPLQARPGKADGLGTWALRKTTKEVYKMKTDLKFDHEPEEGQVQYLIYDAREPMEFYFQKHKTEIIDIERAKFEARWKMRLSVKVRNDQGQIIYDGPSDLRTFP